MNTDLKTGSSTIQQTLRQISETQEYQKLLAALRSNARIISISGLVAGAARALAVAALQRESGKMFAVVAQSTRDLEPWERDLRFWCSALSGKDDSDLLVLPASEIDPYAGVSPHAQTLERRAPAFWQLR
jgi:transcription-repair coupling factor (superfamily II helicase)